MNSPTLHRWSTPLQAAAALADFVALRLREALLAPGPALLVVSGGSTPLPFFDALSRIPLPWSRVLITLADERWLPPDSAQRNDALLRAHLLQNCAAAAAFLPLSAAAATPERAQAELEPMLAALSWPAAVVVLGVGEDGHTASLFPGAAQWPQWLTAIGTHGAPRCCAVDAPLPPNVPCPRISLTPAALLDARALVVHATGSAKWAVLQQALQAGDTSAMPVRLALHQQRVPCDLFIAV